MAVGVAAATAPVLVLSRQRRLPMSMDILRHSGGRIGVALLTLLVCLAVAGPLLVPYGPNQLNPTDAL